MKRFRKEIIVINILIALKNDYMRLNVIVLLNSILVENGRFFVMF